MVLGSLKSPSSTGISNFDPSPSGVAIVTVPDISFNGTPLSPPIEFYFLSTSSFRAELFLFLIFLISGDEGPETTPFLDLDDFSLESDSFALAFSFLIDSSLSTLLFIGGSYTQLLYIMAAIRSLSFRFFSAASYLSFFLFSASFAFIFFF